MAGRTSRDPAPVNSRGRGGCKRAAAGGEAALGGERDRKGSPWPGRVSPHRLRRRGARVARSTTCCGCAACAAAAPPAPAPSWSAGTGPPPSGTRRVASGAARSAPGSLQGGDTAPVRHDTPAVSRIPALTPKPRTWGHELHLSGEAAADAVVVGADIVQAPCSQLLGIVELWAERVSGARCQGGSCPHPTTGNPQRFMCVSPHTSTSFRALTARVPASSPGR